MATVLLILQQLIFLGGFFYCLIGKTLLNSGDFNISFLVREHCVRTYHVILHPETRNNLILLRQ